jgi:hypothetical protein
LQAVQSDRSPIDAARDALDARDRAIAQKAEHGRPIIGRPAAQEKAHLALDASGYLGAHLPAQSGRRPPEEGQKSLIESTEASEPCRHRDFGHRQLCLVDQLLGEQNPPSLGDRDRRSAEVLVK